MIKNNNYYLQEKQKFINNNEKDILNYINSLLTSTDIVKKFSNCGISERRLRRYIYQVAKGNGLSQLLESSTRKYTNCNLLVKNDLVSKAITKKYEASKSLIFKKIEEGLPLSSLSKFIGIESRSIFSRLPQNYKALIVKNNKFHKSKSSKLYHQLKRDEDYQRYQKLILEYVMQNNCKVSIGDLERHFGQLNCIKRVLINNKLYDVIRQYGKELMLHASKRASIKGANKIKELYRAVREEQIQKYEKTFLQLIKDERPLSFIEKDAISKSISIATVEYLFKKYKDIRCKWENSKYYKNPMYGKQPSLKAGIGSSGWIVIENRKIFFRSTLQCQIYCYLLMNDIEFQLSKHKIPYWFEGKVRNYFPDINIGKTIFQIKPKGLINLKQNLAKFQAARIYCKKHYLEFGVLTQQNYPIYERNVNEYISALVNEKAIIFTNERSKLKFINARKEYERTSYTN